MQSPMNIGIPAPHVLPFLFRERQLIAILSSLWMAGQETTTTTLAWALVFVILYPETQRKIQEELDRVVGCNRYVTMDDKPKLHYINAVCQVRLNE